MSDYRQRSRSPYQAVRSENNSNSRRHRHHPTRSRSRSPRRRKPKQTHSSRSILLPYGASSLSKHDLSTYRPLFALYLDIQKQLDIEDLPEDEVKGRWKSFVKKWNAGDLAEGWYDTKTFEKAKRGTFGIREDDLNEQMSRAKNAERDGRDEEDEDDEHDDFGPNLPTLHTTSISAQSQTAKLGPSIPSFSDIQARNEQTKEDVEAAREAYMYNIRNERRADRKQQKDRLEELAPRADPGSRERQLEKKRETTASHRAFAATKESGGDMELRDADVMGDDDSLGELKRLKEMENRKKTEREIRREEVLRTRVAEREERMKGLREKEAKTMEMLKSIARARFGGGSADHGGG